MNLVPALILCNILALLYQLIIEVFTILFRINGITVDKSRFQVISILTGTGFTTSESESMLITRRRRKITQYMMLFSYIFNIAIVSTLVNLFMSTSSTNLDEVELGVILTLVNIFLIFFVRKSNTFKRVLDKMILSISKSRAEKGKNLINVYDTYGNEVIAEVELIHLKPFMVNKQLKDIKLKENFHIQILMIRRNEGIIEYVGADTILKENDVLVVFGNLKNIKRAFVRKVEKTNNYQKEE